MIVNAIQAIEATGRKDGRVLVRAHRSRQAELELDGSLPDVTGFDIEDNGIGFNNVHRDSFDELYTDIKISEGGKGFGRFTCLKYFEDLRVQSIYRDGACLKARSFAMGKEREIIVGEKITDTDASILDQRSLLRCLKLDARSTKSSRRSPEIS